MANEALPILDCHQHFIDARRLTYPVFAQRSAGFEALVGDYAALPRVYLPQDYARDVAGLNVVRRSERRPESGNWQWLGSVFKGMGWPR